MSDSQVIEGIAVPLPMSNLDTDQIMPKQFLRGIDKSGLDKGLLYDLRFDGKGSPRRDCVLNRPEYARCRILIGGENFGCGSSREHAVWGLVQYGIRAVIAPSFGEIFYSNAMNNRLLVIRMSEADVNGFLSDAQHAETAIMRIDIKRLTVRSPNWSAFFTLSARHQAMFLEGQDVLGASLAHRDSIVAFARGHWARQPWLESVAAKTWQNWKGRKA